MGDSGGGGRARGGWCLKQFWNQRCPTAHLVLQLVEADTMAEFSPGAKYDRPGFFCCAFVVRWLRYSILLQRWKCRRGCCYLLCSNTVPCAAQGSKMQRTLPSSPPRAPPGRGKIPSCPRRSGYRSGEEEGWKNPPTQPRPCQCFSYLGTKLSPNLRFAARTQYVGAFL